MAVTVTNDFTVLDAFDNATDQDSDGSSFGNTGSTNANLKVEGTAANYYQAKGIGVGTAGKYNAGNNWNLASTHLYCWFRNLDYFNTQANGGVRIRYTNSALNAVSNFGEWTVGGNDTLRATIDGFTRVAVDTTRTADFTSGTPPATSSVDGLGIGGDQTTASGQNTMFVDQMMTGDVYTIGGGGAVTRGNSSEIAADDYTNGYGVFKDTSGVYFVLVGLTFGNTGTASSYFLDEGQTWLFEPQNVSSTLYTVTFSGNATGTNIAEFGVSSGTGDDETGTGGNTFIANNEPFNIVCIDSNITVGFYGCSFLNATDTGGTIKLEQANAKVVSSLMDACGIITVKNGATLKKTIIVGTASTTNAVEVHVGTFTGNTVDGAVTGVYYPGTHTRTLKNNTYSNNSVGLEFDTAQTVTMDGDTFIGSSGAGVPTEALEDNYPDTNRNTFSAFNATRTQNAQSFTGAGGELTKCTFQMQSVASPTGNMVAYLYAHSGVYGTSSVPTGVALATSDTSLDVSTIPTAGWTLYDFVFSDEYILANGTNYVISIEWTGGDATNQVRVGIDNTTPTHSGNGSQEVSSVWSSTTSDRIFYVYETTYAGGGGDQTDIENSSNATTADSYSETNQNATTALDAAPTAIGQSITGNGGVLSNVRWYIQKVASPTGNAVCELYAHSGTFGTSSVPTGTALARSNNVDVSALSTSLALVQFEFEDQYTLVNATKYVITLEYTGDATNYVNVGTDTTTPTHGGNFSTLNGTWSAVSGTDACFYVSTGGLIIVNAINGANPSSKSNTGSPPGAVIIQNAVTVLIKTITSASVAIENVRVRIVTDPGGVEIINGLTDSNGEIEVSYNYLADQDITGWCRKSTTSPLYKQGDVTGTITSSGFSVTVTMVLDE